MADLFEDFKNLTREQILSRLTEVQRRADEQTKRADEQRKRADEQRKRADEAEARLQNTTLSGCLEVCHPLVTSLMH